MDKLKDLKGFVLPVALIAIAAVMLYNNFIQPKLGDKAPSA
jgi:hypothetical protein